MLSVSIPPLRAVVDFALRRTHGVDAGRIMTRSSWIAGFAATSNVGDAARYGIPASGTMAHAYVQAHAGRLGDEAAGELAAFRAFVRHHGAAAVLLVDTFDVARGIDHAVTVALEHPIRGVRLDSGDLGRLSRLARDRFDAAGLRDVQIVVSGGLDEERIGYFKEAGAPVDSFAVGSAISDASPIDFTGDLKEIDGRPIAKRGRIPGRTDNPRLDRIDLRG